MWFIFFCHLLRNLEITQHMTVETYNAYGSERRVHLNAIEDHRLFGFQVESQYKSSVWCADHNKNL